MQTVSQTLKFRLYRCICRDEDNFSTKIAVNYYFYFTCLSLITVYTTTIENADETSSLLPTKHMFIIISSEKLIHKMSNSSMNIISCVSYHTHEIDLL